MSMACTICNHPKRLEIDRMIVQGISHQKIAKEFGVDSQAVWRHSQNHLSRQLLKAWEIKTTEQSMDILSEVEDLIKRTKRILTTAETEKKYHVALSAIREARGSYELLSKIAFALHQARLSELELERLKAGGEDEESRKANQEKLECLSSDELIILRSLFAKMKSGDKDRRIRIPYSYISRKERFKSEDVYEKEEYFTPIEEEPDAVPEPEYETVPETIPEPKKMMTRTKKPNPLAVKPDKSSPTVKLPRRIDDWVEY